MRTFKKNQNLSGLHPLGGGHLLGLAAGTEPTYGELTGDLKSAGYGTVHRELEKAEARVRGSERKRGKLEKEIRDIKGQIAALSAQQMVLFGQAADVLVEDFLRIAETRGELSLFRQRFLDDPEKAHAYLQSVLQETLDTGESVGHLNAFMNALHKEGANPLNRKQTLDIISGLVADRAVAQFSLENKQLMVPSHALWSDSQLTSSGLAIWNVTYKGGGTDEDADRESTLAAARWGNAALDHGVAMNEKRVGIVRSILQFSAKWAVHAFQRITTSHTYGAALMCSDADAAVLSDIELQWNAFMVLLPNGLLGYEHNGSFFDYTRLLVASYDGSATLILLNQGPTPSSHRIVGQISATLASLLDAEPAKFLHTTDDVALEDGLGAKIARVMTMAKRLVTGLLLALQHQNNFKVRQVPAREGHKNRGEKEPAHRIVFVGSPVKIDCRPAVKDFIAHGSPKRKGAPPSVQTLVRGHHKRQVVGVGRKGRKVIWIEPFWRGPEDAPILTRPKVIQ